MTARKQAEGGRLGHPSPSREPPPLTPARQQSLRQKKVLYYYTKDLLGIWGQWGTFQEGLVEDIKQPSGLEREERREGVVIK